MYHFIFAEFVTPRLVMASPEGMLSNILRHLAQAHQVEPPLSTPPARPAPAPTLRNRSTTSESLLTLLSTPPQHQQAMDDASMALNTGTLKDLLTSKIQHAFSDMEDTKNFKVEKPPTPKPAKTPTRKGKRKRAPKKEEESPAKVTFQCPYAECKFEAFDCTEITEHCVAEHQPTDWYPELEMDHEDDGDDEPVDASMQSPTMQSPTMQSPTTDGPAQIRTCIVCNTTEDEFFDVFASNLSLNQKLAAIVGQEVSEASSPSKFMCCQCVLNIKKIDDAQALESQMKSQYIKNLARFKNSKKKLTNGNASSTTSPTTTLKQKYISIQPDMSAHEPAEAPCKTSPPFNVSKPNKRKRNPPMHISAAKCEEPEPTPEPAPEPVKSKSPLQLPQLPFGARIKQEPVDTYENRDTAEEDAEEEAVPMKQIKMERFSEEQPLRTVTPPNQGLGKICSTISLNLANGPAGIVDERNSPLLQNLLSKQVPKNPVINTTHLSSKVGIRPDNLDGEVMRINGYQFFCLDAERDLHIEELSVGYQFVNETITKYVCYKCGVHMYDQSAILIHLSCHVPNTRDLRCPYCSYFHDKLPSQWRIMKTHLTTHHDANPSSFNTHPCNKTGCSKY